MANVILILGDQLSPDLSALDGADRSEDLVVMAEVHDEASYTNHHKKKLVLLFSAMRHFARQLIEDGWQVYYQSYHPDNPNQSLESVVAGQVKRIKADRVITTECGEWRLHNDISQWHERLGVPVEIRPDTRFIASKDEFADWAKGRKQLRMGVLLPGNAAENRIIDDTRGRTGRWPVEFRCRQSQEVDR